MNQRRLMIAFQGTVHTGRNSVGHVGKRAMGSEREFFEAQKPSRRAGGMRVVRWWTALVVAACALVVSGCMTRIGDMTMVSTRNVSLDRMDIDKLPQTRNVVGEDSRFIFLFIPFGVPHLKDAVDDALNKGKGDLMTDVAIYQGGWWFLVGEMKMRVKGTVVKTRGN